MIKILVTGKGYGNICMDQLEKIWKENHCEVIFGEGPMTEEKLLNHEEIENIDGIVVYSSSDGITANVMKKAKNLKVVSRHGLGLDNIDLQAAEELNIMVTATRHCDEEESVADYVMGLLICIARDIHNMNTKTKQKIWYRPLSTDVTGKTLGIIGLGRIGKMVAKRAFGFEMEILAYDIHRDEEFAQKYNIKYVTFEELIKNSDFITVHCNLTDETKDLISNKEFEMMKETAFVINCGRGAIVNEKALFENLKKKRIAGAAVDVYSVEPPFESNNPLFTEDLDNLITTSHTAVYTREVITKMDLEATLNIIRNI